MKLSLFFAVGVTAFLTIPAAFSSSGGLDSRVATTVGRTAASPAFTGASTTATEHRATQTDVRRHRRHGH